MRKSVPDNQIRALAMAMAGATVAAVATMFVPVGVLEAVSGSTGLSELIPAARAPLGDTARALIAFGAGAMTLAILAYILLRQDGSSPARAAPSVPASEWAEESETPSFKDRLAGIKLPSLALPKMPWMKGEDDITELADLPKLRNGDSHPDAPPRRPLVASMDLPVLDLAEMPEVLSEPQAEPIEPIVVTEAAALPDEQQEAEIEVAEIATVAADHQPTLAEMVAQLEAAVAERQKQLAELEAVANKLASNREAVEGQLQPDVEIVSEQQPVIEAPRYERPPLEAVPSVSVKDDDMDSALAAALATLHRMNATGR